MARMLSQEDKHARRCAIMNAGLNLLRGLAYSQVTVDRIVRMVGIAKGTFFLYFASKEELFLDALLKEYEGFTERFIQNLPSASEKGVDAVAQLIADGYANSLDLMRCLVQVHSVIEANVSDNVLLEAKRKIAQFLGASGDALEAAIPQMEKGDGERFLSAAHAMAVGFAGEGTPRPSVREALEREGIIDLFDLDFRATYTRAVTRLLRGFLSTSGTSEGSAREGDASRALPSSGNGASIVPFPSGDCGRSECR